MRRPVFSLIPLLTLFFLAGAAGRSWADDEPRIVSLRTGDRVEVEVDSRGRVNVVRTAANGAGRSEKIPIAKGERVVFQVSDELPKEEVVKVLRALDGDTIVVELRGREERVRLLGIDTPEIYGDFYSVEAWDKTTALAAGKTARLVYDEKRTEDLGRLLAYVYVGNVCVNAELLAGGYARMPNRTDLVLMSKYDEFCRLTEEAQAKRLGIWNEDEARIWESRFSKEDHYVASRTTFHRPSCPHAQGLLEPEEFRTVEAALKDKKNPCSKCLPTRNYDPEEKD